MRFPIALLPLSVLASAAFAAAIEIGPVTGAPGATVRVVGERFPPHSAVTVTAGPPGSAPETLARIRSDARGWVDARVEVPASAAPHDRIVFVVSAGGGRVEARSIPFAIERPERGRVSVTGVVTGDGVECPQIATDDGRRYTLAGAEVRNLVPGDRVRIEGTIAEISFCMQGTTVAVESLTFIERARQTR